MLPVSLLVMLSAAPVSVAVPGVTCVGLSPQLCESFLDRFVAVLSEQGSIKAVAQKDIAQVLGLERQRKLLGCDEASSTSCLAELAGALGVDGIASISIARSDPYFVATARIVHARDGSQWVSASERVGREGELFDSMDAIASKFRAELTRDLPSATGARWVRWTPGIVGAGAVIAGTVVFFSAGSERTQLAGGTLLTSDVREVVEAGRTKEQLGVGLWIGGGVAIAASIVWVLMTPIEEKKPVVAIAPITGGAAFVIGGRLP